MTAYLPSPTVGVLHLGPLPIRMYAVCILAGIVLAVWLTGRRLVARGYPEGSVLDIAGWAVIFGIVG
ncbi:MAG TPA: prolipoprotein diacylglyceryl transferase family protein, partial [Phycicoccus sp.]